MQGHEKTPLPGGNCKDREAEVRGGLRQQSAAGVSRAGVQDEVCFFFSPLISLCCCETDEKIEKKKKNWLDSHNISSVLYLIGDGTKTSAAKLNTAAQI